MSNDTMKTTFQISIELKARRFFYLLSVRSLVMLKGGKESLFKDVFLTSTYNMDEKAETDRCSALFVTICKNEHEISTTIVTGKPGSCREGLAVPGSWSSHTWDPICKVLEEQTPNSGVPPFVKTFTMRRPELQFPLGISFSLKINSILKLESNCLLIWSPSWTYL